MNPAHATLARIERELDDAIRRGDTDRVNHLRLERGDLKLLAAVDRMGWLVAS